jgi:hypothetical protein
VKPPRKPSPRAARRAQSRTDAKLLRDLERLAQLQPGGSPAHPLELSSASQVEVRARATPCPLCEGPLRLEEHAAEVHGAARLRVARMVCGRCGARRTLYFRLGTTLPS